ncbi:uncharacterized protein RCO7_02699 [Rhynchosporium graminicola]|uniref:Uncharacterized protein n=1 Tax=Rhynchosporium graminicola TaxID=2792576 RepID=A0A1E1KG43_9HELO|nr:uncharacterized protein RCO7_02699 [Rhynchosporium commune]
MEVIQILISLPKRLLTSLLSTSRQTRINFLAINTLITILVCTSHVYITGWYYYTNERIYVTRGFRHFDSEQCDSALRSTQQQASLWKGTWPIQWYWRMQCEGGRDKWRGNGGLRSWLNRDWFWLLFDAFWIAVAGPCFNFASSISKTVTQIYSSGLAALLISAIERPFHITGNSLLRGVQWTVESIAILPTYLDGVPYFLPLAISNAPHDIGSFLHEGMQWATGKGVFLPTYLDHVSGSIPSTIKTPLNSTGDVLSEAIQYFFGLVASYASYFDYVPFIKTTFAMFLGWVKPYASSFAATKSFEFWLRLFVYPRNPLSEAINHVISLWKWLLVILQVVVSSFVYISTFDIWTALVPATGVPYFSLLTMFTIWINVYVHRTYTINEHNGVHWTKNLWHTPFALLDVLCFGSEDKFTPDDAPRVHRSWHSSNDLILPHMEWHWNEIPMLIARSIISPIYNDGFLRGLRYWRYILLQFWSACEWVWRIPTMKSIFGVNLGIVCFRLHSYPYFRYEVGKFLIDILAGIFFLSVLLIIICIWHAIYRLGRTAWTTVFSRLPFSQFGPSNPVFYLTIIRTTISQFKVLLILFGFNKLMSTMGIPLTFTYTSCLIYGMASRIAEYLSPPIVGEKSNLRKYRLITFTTLFRVITIIIYFSDVFPLLYRFYTPESIITNPLLYLHSGITLDLVYHGLSIFETRNLFQDFCIGLFLLLDYLRIPGRLWLLRQIPWESELNQLEASEDVPAISSLEAAISGIAVLIEMLLSSTMPRLAIFFAAFLGACLFEDAASINSDDDERIQIVPEPPRASLYSSLEDIIGTPCVIFLTLLVTVQLTNKTYFSGDTYNAVFRVGFGLIVAQFMVPFPMKFVPRAHPVVGVIEDTPAFKRKYTIPWEGLICAAQITALLLTAYALTYLTFNLAFYSLAVPLLLLVLYYLSPATQTTLRGQVAAHRPHGLQAVLSKRLVFGWARHLWWIIPGWSIIQSLIIIRNCSAIIDHFQNFTLEYFITAWRFSSYLSIAFAVISFAIYCLAHIREQHKFLSILYHIGSTFTSYLPFSTLRLRNAFFFRDYPGGTYQARAIWIFISLCLFINLQIYNPGCWSLGIPFLIWDIIKVEDTGAEAPFDSSLPPAERRALKRAAKDARRVNSQRLAERDALARADVARSDAREVIRDTRREQAFDDFRTHNSATPIVPAHQSTLQTVTRDLLTIGDQVSADVAVQSSDDAVRAKEDAEIVIKQAAREQGDDDYNPTITAQTISGPGM